MVRSGFKVGYYNYFEDREIYISLKYLTYSYIIIHTDGRDAVLTLNRYEA